MKLRFYARDDLMVREVGDVPRVGQPTRYYGRTFDPQTRGYPATREAFEVESDSQDGEKCRKQCRKGTLWAADEATASAIGVPFVAVEFVDGAWVKKLESRPARSKSTESKGVES